MHKRKIGRNRNSYPDVDSRGYLNISSTEWTKAFDENERRLGYRFSDPSGDYYILEEEPDDPMDDTPKGFIQFKRTLYITPDDLVPIGQIWLLAKSGNQQVMIEQF